MAFFLDILDDNGSIDSLEVEKEAQEVKAMVPPNESVTHLLIKPEAWGWEQLRDYVITQSEKQHGRQPRNPLKEKAIFQSFANRWGDKASAIAQFAFEVQKGVWHRAPITVNRFAKNSDPFFAEVIVEQLGI